MRTARTGRLCRSAPPPPRRLAAGVVDVVVDWSPLLLVALLSRSIHGAVLAVLVVLGAAGVLAIVVVNEFVCVTRSGQSVGKRLLAIQVVDVHAMMPPDVGQLFWRNLLRSIQFGVVWHPFGTLTSFIVVVGPWPVICYAPQSRIGVGIADCTTGGRTPS